MKLGPPDRARLCAVLFLAIGTCGCGDLLRSSRPPLAAINEVRQHVIRHDAGQVIQGARVSHTYVFLNDTDQPLQYDPEGLRTSCRCAGVEVSATRLGPGAKCEIEVEVNTEDLSGGISETVAVRWLLPDGDPLYTLCVFEASVSPLFEVSPRSIRFSREEVSQGAVKEFAITSAFGPDWASLSFRGGRFFEIVDIQPADTARKCRVRCVPGQSTQPALDSTLAVVLEAAVAGETQRAVIAVRLSADYLPDLVAIPPSLVLLLDENGQGMLPLRLRGARLTAAEPQEMAISAPGFRIDNRRQTAISAEEWHLHLWLRRVPAEHLPPSANLRIELASGDKLEVPMLLTR